MSRIPPRLVNAYIFGNNIRASNCLSRRTPRFCAAAAPSASRRLTSTSQRLQELENASTTSSSAAAEPVPLRKQIKEEIKRRKVSKRTQPTAASQESLEGWELTIGIEIHAQLNTSEKLFSSSPNTNGADPNSMLSFFDLALPGSQPQFQIATLIPALRAALALGCGVQKESSWDRKHYFHWDQPSGYQITQFYQPFAKNGSITLFPHDGIAAEDIATHPEGIKINIKQIQMEQDTAKTITQGNKHFLDFNRVGTPLIEIITGPDMHHPSTAAAYVKKIQTILFSVDACVLGMEQGGLRADVNVSVRRRGEVGNAPEYNGVSGLGTRTEIKNLSSFKSIRDAIIVERDRQIEVLESGGKIEGETRGYNIGDTYTTRLRGKEGEVDYRYMPDPDLPPLLIGDELVNHLKATMGVLPDAELKSLTEDYGLSMKDALSLVALDDGYRADYFYTIVDGLIQRNVDIPDQPIYPAEMTRKWGPVALNWVLHELGSLRLPEGTGILGETSNRLFDFEGQGIVQAEELVDIITWLEKGMITGKTAKYVLGELYRVGSEAFMDSDGMSGWRDAMEERAQTILDDEHLWYEAMPVEEYEQLAKETLEDRLWVDILGKNKKKADGKIMYWVGKMMREGGGKCDAVEARKTIERLAEVERKKREVKEEEEAKG